MKINQIPKFSIIIPHFNSLPLLLKLIESIPALHEIEIIVVDDKSTMYTQDEILSALSYRVLKYFSNDSCNKGAGACRNIGIINSTGKWLLFADADDFFVKGFYKIISAHYNSNSDIIFFPPTSVYIDSGEKADRHLQYEKLVEEYIDKQSKRTIEAIRYSFPVPWSKLFKRSFLIANNLRFEEIIASNDIFFSVKAGHYANLITACNQIIYCATTNKGSLTQTVNKSILFARIDTVTKLNKFFKSIGKKNYQRSYMNYIYESFKIGWLMPIFFLIYILAKGGNPLIGYNRWFFTFLQKFKKRNITKKYQIIDKGKNSAREFL